MTQRSISEKLHQTTFGKMYDLHDEHGRGRALILTHLVLSTVITTIADGAFYTSFLTIYGIDIISVGILTFVPYIAQLLSLSAPYILERMARRKWFLAACRCLYSLLHILGVTVLPELVADPSARLPWLVGLILAANIVNALSTQGYTVWHAQYLPKSHRFSYFFSQTLTCNALPCAIAIFLALIADAAAGTAIANAVIIGIRYLAFAIALLDLFVLLRIKEYPYPRRKAKVKFLDVFTLPLKHKKFLCTMAVCFCYTFATYLCPLSIGVFMYYLLNDAGAPYSLPYTVDLCFSLFLVLFYRHWNQKLEKQGWIRVFSTGVFLESISLIFLAFVNRQTVLWLFPLVRMFQHYYSAGRNTAFSNFMYMNTPLENQTTYITFYSLGQSLCMFLGISFGTWFVGTVGSRSLSVLGCTFTAVPLLLLVQAAAQGLLFLFIRLMEPVINPNNASSEVIL